MLQALVRARRSAPGTRVADAQPDAAQPAAAHPPMNTNLLRSCIALWILGMVGMWVARAVLELDPTALPFQVAARFWLVGGVGYAGLGLCGVVVERRAKLPTRSSDTGDSDAQHRD